MPSPAVAVIDIGSNSIKVLVATLDATGRLRALHAKTIDARISAGLSQAEPRLSEAGMARGLAAVQELIAAAAPFSPERHLLVATSAVRDALNGTEFRARVHAATGHAIRLLSGDEEANLIGGGLTCDPALADLRDFYVFDLGGGSLECLAFRQRRISQAVSLQLGCVRLTEKFVSDPTAPFLSQAQARLAAYVGSALEAAPFKFNLPEAVGVGTGGTVSTVRAIIGTRSGLSAEATPPFVSVDQLREMLGELGAMPLARRQQVPGLPAARADVFPAALATIIAIAEAGNLAQFRHSFYNLRWGLAAEALA